MWHDPHALPPAWKNVIEPPPAHRQNKGMRHVAAKETPKEPAALDSYVIAHGEAGRARLRVLAEVMTAGSEDLFRRVGISPGTECLDVGCGGGDVSVLLARHVGPSGRVVGIDLDPKTLAAARSEAKTLDLPQLSYRQGNVFDLPDEASFDVVYARFLLTPLAEPQKAIDRMRASLRPGGLVLLEDIDFSGHFAYPACPAFEDYQRLYVATVRKAGGDPNIGQRLPLLLKAAELEEVGLQVSQAVALQGAAKLISPITLEAIGERVVAAGLATPAELKETSDALFQAARDPDRVMSAPRIVQSWGRKPR